MIHPATIAKKLTRYEWFSIGLLAVCALFAAYFSAKWLIINADATSSVYLMKGHISWGDILIADWHTNLIKLPITFFQAHIPFTMHSFVAVNAILLFGMMFGWACAMAVAFGRKFLLPMALLLSFVLAGSSVLPTETAFTTIRNIEYPIYFLLVILFWCLFASIKRNTIKSDRTRIALFIIAMAVLQASDPFFIYATIPAILFLLLLHWKQGKLSKRGLAQATGILLAPFIAAKLLILCLFQFGMFHYYGETMNPTFYEFVKIPGQFWSGIHDIIRLFNADFFGNTFELRYIDRFIMAVICIAGFYTYTTSWRKIKQLSMENLPYATLLLSTGLLFVLYIAFSAFEQQIRFLVLLVLTMCTSAVLWAYSKPSIVQSILSYIPNQRRLFYGCIGAIIIMLGLSYNTYRLNNFYGLLQQQTNLTAIDNYIATNGANTVITGHSYGSTLSFWTNGTLQYIPVLYCNQNLPFLTRESWYKASADTSRNVALVVDKNGRDANSWYCSNKRIQEYYGKPYAMKTLAGIDNKPVDVYIYPKDILNKIHFIKHKGTPKPLLAN
jgi:hypothetical protein